MAQGKTVIVTGSTSGIGLGIATSFAASGAKVVLNGLGDAGQIEKLRESLAQTHGTEVFYHPADMTRPEQIHDLVEQTVARFGGVDVVVNNAGIQFVAPVEDFPEEKWKQVLDINLSSAFHLIKAAIPHMQRKGFGRIINIASAHGKVASIHKAAYVAAKHGILGLTKVVALENAGRGITANAICPGWVLTPLVKEQIEKRARESGRSFEQEKTDLLKEKQPSGEFVTVEEIGGLALYLASDLARSITGAAISIDGGWTAQ